MKYLITLLFFCLSASAQVNDSMRAQVMQYVETLVNPGFEEGRARWTASGGTVLAVTTGSNLLVGKTSVTWDSSAAAQTYCSDLVTIPQGALGRAGVGSMIYKVPSGTSTHVVQVRDGSANVLATTGALSYAGGTSDSRRVSTQVFTFPSSGTIRLCVVSVAADEPLIAMDSMTLSSEPMTLSQISQAAIVGTANQAGAANCNFTQTTSSSESDYVTLGTAGSCAQAWTVTGGVTAVGATSHQQTFNNMPPGIYEISVAAFQLSLNANIVCNYRFSDGTTSFGYSVSYSGGLTGTSNLIGTIEYTTAASRTFRVQSSDNGAGDCNLANGSTGRNIIWTFKRFPNASQLALRPDLSAWKVDANISGANPSLGTSAVTTYTGIENGSLTMVQNAGSAPVQIGCSSTNAPSGMTCSAGNESVSVSFSPPVAGDYLACASFSWYGDVGAGGSLASAFQVVETATNAQTIVQEGKTRTQPSVGGTSSTQIATPARICGNFTFSSTTPKMLRLMFEQSVAVSVSASLLYADALASNGQRDIHWEIYPVNPWLLSPLLVNSIVTGSNGVERIERAFMSGTCVASRTSSGWITSVSGSGAGSNCVMTLAAGTFSALPVCVATAADNGNTQVAQMTVSSATSIQVRVFLSNTAGTGSDAPSNIICMGPR